MPDGDEPLVTFLYSLRAVSRGSCKLEAIVVARAPNSIIKLAYSSLFSYGVLLISLWKSGLGTELSELGAELDNILFSPFQNSV